jgi:hypothetical protein
MVSQTGSLTIDRVLKTAFPPWEGDGGKALDSAIHVIPQGDGPRWVVVGDSRNAAHVFRSWRPFKIGTRLRWSAVVAASSLGLLSRLPGVITRRAPIDFSYWRQCLPGFQDDWIPVLYIGNLSHTRKITIFFVGKAEGGFRAVAKVPLYSLSGQAILSEAAVLEQLDQADYLPRLLFRDQQRGVAAQSWLEGEPISRKLTAAHMDLLARFEVPGASIRVSSLRASIARELEQADLPFDQDVLNRAQEFLDYDEALPAFIEHRDFAPWNLKRLADGRTGAIDWEWTVLRGLPCQDIFRYFYIQDALFYGPGTAWEVLNKHPFVREHYRRFAIPSQALPALAMHYQLRVLAMDWQSGNSFLAQYAFRQVKSLLNLSRREPFRLDDRSCRGGSQKAKITKRGEG